MNEELKGIKLEEKLILPEARYEVECLRWHYRESSIWPRHVAQLDLQIIGGPFEGRHLTYTIGSNEQLASVLLTVGVAYNEDTTAREGLNALKDLRFSVMVRHRLKDGLVFAEPHLEAQGAS